MLKRSCNIFGDIAGRYDELQLLVKKMPKGIPVSVGDMVDRGDKSQQVLDFFRLNGMAVLGNHEHQMIEYYNNTGFYDEGIWFINGGLNTVQSFRPTIYLRDTIHFKNIYALVDDYYNGLHVPMDRLNYAAKEVWPTVRRMIRPDYIKWLASLPLMLEMGELIITHAAINPSIPFDRCLNIGASARSFDLDKSVLWNTGSTRRIKDRFQIHGHTSHKRCFHLKDKQGGYGVNLDSSAGKKLTGINWPTMQIFEQDYLS